MRHPYAACVFSFTGGRQSWCHAEHRIGSGQLALGLTGTGKKEGAGKGSGIRSLSPLTERQGLGQCHQRGKLQGPSSVRSWAYTAGAL